jgi:ribosomal protein S12 methylthiotransferase accessory factor
VEEVRRIVAFFHQAGHNVYIRDVSYLGFPSILAYVPEVSAKWLEAMPAPGLSAMPLSIALASIEARALKLKQCSPDDLAAVTEVFKRLPPASKFFDILGIELKGSSPWRGVNLAFLLTQIYFRLEQFGKAYECLQAFLETRPEVYRYRYYTGVGQYLALRAEGFSHAEAAQRLAEDPDWGEAGRSIAADLQDPSRAFQFVKLPNCPDCTACELSPECATAGALAIVARLYPAMRESHIEQKELAWISSGDGAIT